MRVRSNLHAALSILRKQPTCQFSEDPGREIALIHQHFWVDAICINQNDVHERGHQVNLMAHIYSDASCVIAWLGPEAEDSAPAVETLRCGLSMNDSDKPMSASNYTQTRPHTLSALRSLFDRSYWRRIWVVQEFSLATNLLILCGYHGVWWERLSEIVSIGRRELAFLGWYTETSPGAAWWALGNTRHQWQLSTGDMARRRGAKTLDELLMGFHWSECNDVRDRVYALLSLVKRHASGSEPLLADYTISANRLYYRVLCHLRYSETLRDHLDWRQLKRTLRDALGISENNGNFRRHEFLYKSTEIFRAKVTIKTANLEAKNSIAPLIREMRTSNSFYLEDTGRENASARTLQLYQSFPREDDPDAWRAFERLVTIIQSLLLGQKRLGTGISAFEIAGQVLDILAEETDFKMALESDRHLVVVNKEFTSLQARVGVKPTHQHPRKTPGALPLYTRGKIKSPHGPPRLRQTHGISINQPQQTREPKTEFPTTQNRSQMFES